MKKKTGKTIWFTGLSGSGKSTLSSQIKMILEQRNVNVVLLDGDALRTGLNRDLGFSAEDRAENIRRAGETAKILSDAGHTVLAAFITPLETLRRAVRNLFEPQTYTEIYLECSLSVCETRDPKGLYKKARQGEIPQFTGISSPFEVPETPDLLISTDRCSPEESVDLIIRFLEKRFPDLQDEGRFSFTKQVKKRKVAVIGLDGAPASLVFDRFKGKLPTFDLLMEHGIWGPLKSTDPPITIPAWTCMTTGKDPGELGLYGFRNRAYYDYSTLTTADSSCIDALRVWDQLESRGARSILVGIPQTYPAREHNGITVAGFPATRDGQNFTYPVELSQELDTMAGGPYMEDVREFRNRALDELSAELEIMLDRRFKVAARLLTSNPWDFFMMVEIAPDRAHHVFWSFFDPDHPRYQPGRKYENFIPEFYERIDSRLNSLLSLMDDETTVIIVSDHGAMPCHGGVCVNEWLIEKGYLYLKEYPEGVVRLSPDMIDWSRTSAWSEGGYYGRIFLNVKNREPQGIIEPDNYHAFRDELATRLASISDINGQSIINEVLKPDELYVQQRNIPPDLMVYFDGLKRRALSTVGSVEIFVDGAGFSLDDCNHDPLGIFICVNLSDLRSGLKVDRKIEGMTYKDVSSFILDTYDHKSSQRFVTEQCFDESLRQLEFVSSVIKDSSINVRYETKSVQTVGFSSEEEETVRKRLEELGYI